MNSEELNLEDIIKIINENIDFTSIFDNIIDIYEDIRPKIIKRKIIVKGKRKYIKLLRYNPLYDLLPSPRMLTMGLRILDREL